MFYNYGMSTKKQFDAIIALFSVKNLELFTMSTEQWVQWVENIPPQLTFPKVSFKGNTYEAKFISCQYGLGGYFLFQN